MNTALLEYHLKINGKSKKDLQVKLGISRSALYRKLHGKTQFVLVEMQEIVDWLDLSADVAYNIFFAKEVA